ncbi:PilZ domain-containing protein [Sphingomonas sp. So64.6b]|uniref:PilZ domain-containing protein n=1 Tax=Sphingomonas sp. So64.6b TaxID=2997354 RepID=UPI001602DFAD|nr:PilZ domain-containing protein [Sphingomonas sp. So64.6b]QNA85128.1 PilZ domain-containing protein [Sphingomonas sp. So64.6b]
MSGRPARSNLSDQGLSDDMSGGEAPSDPGAGPAPPERAPRRNLLLAATIDAPGLHAPVRIRNLSESGAMLEGAVFPDIGEPFTLRRAELSITATVVWRAGSRCGVRLDGVATVADWVAGKRVDPGPGAGRNQQYVDRVQAAVRAGTVYPDTQQPPAPAGKMSEADLTARLAQELAYVKRLLEAVGDELTDDGLIVQKHSRSLQDFDLACQILGHLAAILAAPDRGAAVDAVALQDLRARLQRGAIF